MIGAITGDIVGSVYEFEPTKSKEFKLFKSYNQITDDSILTFAVFSALEKCNGDYENLSNITSKELISWYSMYSYPLGGYGTSFYNWAFESFHSKKVLPPYGSYGNGSAMRVSPVAYFAESLEQCIELSRKVTEVTHNHPEGIKGAEATAVAIYLALHGKTKLEIKKHINDNYYRLDRNCNIIRELYYFDGSCQGTVPESIQAFLDSTCYEDAVRIAISLGGDADTMGAITGAIAEAYYGIPKYIEDKVFRYLDERTSKVVKRMIEKRNNIIHKHTLLRFKSLSEKVYYSKIIGIDEAGLPNNFQRSAKIIYKGITYSSTDDRMFLTITESNESRRMNDEEFCFFIDQIRHYLFMRFADKIDSVEDYFSDLMIEMSIDYWK